MNILKINIDGVGYPEQLKNIYDPPKNLFIRGELLAVDLNSIAIVGTRKCSEYGARVAHDLSYELALKGITIISGLASGIDTSAHKAALEAGGRTIAVLAGGLDKIFPPENTKLAEEITNHGALMSENPPGTSSYHYFFPKRNRIISGLAKGVIVVEAGYKSGAMITAKLGLDQGKEVFAVPGSIYSENSRGVHWLIKEGAKLVESIEDITQEIDLLLNDSVNGAIKQNYSQLSFEEQNIIQYLSHDPKFIDDLIVNSGLNIPAASNCLTGLELKGLVRQLPGKRFVLN